MENRVFHVASCIFAISWVLGLLPDVGEAGTLTEEEKKATVYRMYDKYKEEEFPSVEDISARDAMALAADKKAVFVDTRRPQEIAVSKIPGAVPEETFLKKPEKYSGKTVIGYCTISYRSGVLAEKLAKKGIRMKNLRGGILAWTLEGGTVIDPEGRPVQKLHVYAEKWDFAPEGYSTVTFGWLERLF